MKQLFYSLLLLLHTLIIVAQPGSDYEGPIPRIMNGFGAFGNHPISEVRFDNTYAVNNYGAHPGDEITIRYASDIGGPMPTVMFASGYAQYEPEIFDSLLNFIASKGFAVVFTPYKTGGLNEALYGDEWGNIMYNGMKQAIDDYPGIIAPSKLGFFGHSLGAGYIYWLANKLYVDDQYGQDAKFLFSVAGWIGFRITRAELQAFPADCPLLVQIWEEDDIDTGNNNTSPRIQYDLFHEIGIPFHNKNYIKIKGGPDVNGYHYSTTHSLVKTQLSNAKYNALDFYTIFRMLDAMMDYTFNDNPASKNIALGFDTDMGPFPDLDNDYNTFVFAHDESTYDFKCDVSANIHRAYCPTAPLGISYLEPLSVRLINNQAILQWSTLEEWNNKGFEIQKSLTATNWKTIGWVDAQENKQQYKTTDPHTTQGLNYYRLKQIDIDNKYSYSNIVHVDNTLQNEISLAPNPISDYLQITNQSKESIQDIKIISTRGEYIQNISFDNTTIDLTLLPPGTYTIVFTLETYSVRKKIIKL